MRSKAFQQGAGRMLAANCSRKGYRIRGELDSSRHYPDRYGRTDVSRAQRAGTNDTTAVRQGGADTVPWERLGVPMDIAKGISWPLTMQATCDQPNTQTMVLGAWTSSLKLVRQLLGL